MKLESIPVQVAGPASGMPGAILMEIAELLEQLAEKNIAGGIDLRSMPMSDEDRTRLENHLGRGEVSAWLDVAGASEIWETSYPGVWWVRHRGGDGKITSEEISVTRVPDILLAPHDDIRDSAARIVAELSSSDVSDIEEEFPHD